jgi:shikimate dehydrogenase
VNGTSAGLAGNVPSVPRDVVRGAFCYDMAYGQASARFLAWVSQAGARASADGLGMLVEQAAEAFRLWHAVLPRTAPVLATLRRELAEQRS